MKLKSTDEAIVEITNDGRICIQQFSNEVYLTSDQIEGISGWVFKNRDEIKAAWNDGIEYE